MAPKKTIEVLPPLTPLLESTPNSISPSTFEIIQKLRETRPDLQEAYHEARDQRAQRESFNSPRKSKQTITDSQADSIKSFLTSFSQKFATITNYPHSHSFYSLSPIAFVYNINDIYTSHLFFRIHNKSISVDFLFDDKDNRPSSTFYSFKISEPLDKHLSYLSNYFKRFFSSKIDQEISNFNTKISTLEKHLNLF